MAVDSRFIEYVAGLVIREIEHLGHTVSSTPASVSVGISARHVHLTRDHVDILFGKDYKLTRIKDLSQPGQFASKETVTLLGPKGKIEKVRILGPERRLTQVEVSASDARILGVQPIVRNSGDIEGTPGLTIIGTQGSVDIDKGVILADRHIHMSPEEAGFYGVKDGDRVKISIPGRRGGVLDNVVIRVHQDYRMDLHIDTDEANAFLLKQGDILEFAGRMGDINNDSGNGKRHCCIYTEVPEFKRI